MLMNLQRKKETLNTFSRLLQYFYKNIFEAAQRGTDILYRGRVGAFFFTSLKSISVKDFKLCRPRAHIRT